MSYDTKCRKLAEEFLEDYNPSELQLHTLAYRIQGAVDDFFEDLSSEIEAKRDEAIDRKMDEKRLG